MTIKEKRMNIKNKKMRLKITFQDLSKKFLFKYKNLKQTSLIG